MDSTTFPAIPQDTATAARSIFGRSNFYLVTGDQANHLFDGLNLGNRNVKLDRSPRTLAMLHLITMFQFIEALPDQLAAEALRERLDWKYALHLPLNDPGLEAALFCEFRSWLLADQAAQQNLRSLLQRLSEILDFTGKQKTNLEPGQIISGVCQITRMAWIWEALKQALEAVATRYPDWQHAASLPHWYERYRNPLRISNLIDNKLEMHALVHQAGADGIYLLKAVSESGVPGMVDLPEILMLEQVWRKQYEDVEGKPLWRKEACAGCFYMGIMSNSTLITNQDK